MGEPRWRAVPKHFGYRGNFQSGKFHVVPSSIPSLSFQSNVEISLAAAALARRHGCRCWKTRNVRAAADWRSDRSSSKFFDHRNYSPPNRIVAAISTPRIAMLKFVVRSRQLSLVTTITSSFWDWPARISRFREFQARWLRELYFSCDACDMFRNKSGQFPAF